MELPQDEDAEAGGGRAQERADGIDDEPDGEQALAAVAVGELAAGDHQRGHDQQEDGDRDLDALDGGVQVLAHVVDHHIHVGTGEAADELRQGERNQYLPQRGRWSSCRAGLCHLAPTSTNQGCRLGRRTTVRRFTPPRASAWES
jgi:hypothetical protein